MRRVLMAIGVAIGAVFVLNVAAEIVETVSGGPGPQGPPSSAFATAPAGFAAYAELLEQHGHTVRLEREELIDLPADPSATLVVLDPAGVRPDDVTAMRSHLDAGGRLVIGGADPVWVDRVLVDAPIWDADGIPVASSFVPVELTAGVRTVHADGTGSWTETGPALPVIGSGGRSIVAVVGSGAGTAVLVADPSPFQNRLLDEADNAALGLNLVGEPGRTVRFAEAVHGFGPAGGLGAIPLRWRWMLAGLVLATVVWMLARGRRLGPPEAPVRDLPPPRRDYVDAMAVTLARTKDPAALDPVRHAIRDRLSRRAGIAADAPMTAIERVARREGLAGDEIAALAGGRDVLALGRALARMEDRP